MNVFYKLLQVIDDGRLLRKGVKWFYYFKAVILFALPIYVIYGVIKDSPSFVFRTYYYHGGNTWAVILAILFIALLFFLAFINFFYWTNRARKLESIVRQGDSVVAIPLAADNIKNDGEILAFIFLVGYVGLTILQFLLYLLTGHGEFFKYLIITISTIVVAVIISFFIIFLFRFISEGIRMIAQMCNDLRDVADIHRAATINDQEYRNDFDSANNTFIQQ